MKNNNRKKLFITLSSGILLSLAVNQEITYAAETEQPEIRSTIGLVNNVIAIEDITAYSIEGESKVEVKDLIEQITITQINAETYKVSGNTVENSEVILLIDDIEKSIGISDEKGHFEIEIKDLLIASSMQVIVKDTQENTYTTEFSLIDFIEKLEIIDQDKNDDLSDTKAASEDEQLTPIAEEPLEVSGKDEESMPVVEESTEVPSKGEESVPTAEKSEEVIIEDEESITVVEEPKEVISEAKTSLPETDVPRVNAKMMQSFSMATTTVSRTAVNGVYTVNLGDYSSTIANSFDISLDQLLAWNPQIKNANLISVGQKVNVTKAAYEKYISDNKGNNQVQPRPFKTNQEFIDFITPYAMKIANANGENQLYASVMIAQAAHESAFGQSLLASPPYYNLFGIKGSYSGQTIPMGTWEDINGKISNITANFRDYPSYYESMMDYADLIRTGLTGSPNFYSEAWVKNTTSYRDATKYLTNKYATDDEYNIRLNNVIEQYNLTQYDTYIVDTNIDNIVNVSYNALISLSGYSIDTKPWGTSGYKNVDKTNTYLGSSVQVIKETNNGNYVLISYNGTPLGWVDKKALEISTHIGNVSSSISVNYKAKVSKSGFSIDTLPWGTSGYKMLDKSANYIGKEIEVIKEASSGKYSLISMDGELLGWIDSKAISPYDIDVDIISSNDISYKAIVNKTGFSIDTKPWGASGYHTLNQTTEYLGRTIQVVKETNNKNYVLISHDEKLLGWVDKKALKTYEIVINVALSQSTNYKAIIDKPSYSVDTKPWGLTGYQTTAKTSDYMGTEVNVIRKLGSYVLISVNGEAIGWVDKKALKTYEVVTSIPLSQSTNYKAMVNKSLYSIDTKPWGITGYQKITETNDYMGTEVDVIRKSGSYVLISVNGKAIGWVDKKALKTYTVEKDISESKFVSFTGIISKAAYSIDTKPWGTKEYQTISTTNEFIGIPVKIIKQKGAYFLVETNGQMLGWVDKKAIQFYTVDTAISSTKNVSYNAIITKAAYSIDTRPWGTKGYQTVKKTNSFIGKKVNVMKETKNGDYVLISLDGTTLGWVDKKALNN